MPWEALLEEVLNQNTKSKTSPVDQPLSSPKKIKKFFLGTHHRNVYFTNREAEVMVQLLQGKTLSAAASILNLSPRTIEFYVKNMKTKLACRTKSELIGKVFASEFVKHVDFMANLYYPSSLVSESESDYGREANEGGVQDDL